MKTIFTIAFLFLMLTMNGQERVSSIGLRLGGLSGVSFNFIDEDFRGFELMVGSKDGGFNFTGLLKKYKPIATNRVAGLFVFMGGGAHTGYTRNTIETMTEVDGTYYYSQYTITDPVLGGDFMMGAAYHFETIPLHLSLDYKPYFEIFGEKTFRLDLWDFGFTIKYAFNG